MHPTPHHDSFHVRRAGARVMPGVRLLLKTGSVVIKPNFALADNFRDGLAFVYDSLDLPHAKYGYIDKTGKVVWEPTR